MCAKLDYAHPGENTTPLFDEYQLLFRPCKPPEDSYSPIPIQPYVFRTVHIRVDRNWSTIVYAGTPTASMNTMFMQPQSSERFLGSEDCTGYPRNGETPTTRSYNSASRSEYKRAVEHPLAPFHRDSTIHEIHQPSTFHNRDPCFSQITSHPSPEHINPNPRSKELLSGI